MADSPDRSADLDQRRIAISLLLIFGAVAIAVVVAGVLITSMGGATPPAKQPPPTLQPRLEAHPSPDLAHYRAAQETILSGYGWVDRRAGIVRIPIERAMDIVARRGAKSSGDADSNGSARPGGPPVPNPRISVDSNGDAGASQ